MIKVLFTTDENLCLKIRESYWLTQVDISDSWSWFSVYKKMGTVLVFSSDDEKTFRQAFLYAYTEYDPTLMIYLSVWELISNELRQWDIVLPNVFFEYDKNINSEELDRDNRDSYLKDPIFLEQYSIQNDYNFEDFWLIVWWISVSSDIALWSDEVIESVRVAYEADVSDKNAYWFVLEAKTIWILEKAYAMIGINETKSDLTYGHMMHVLDFLISNISDVSDIEVEDNEEITY